MIKKLILLAVVLVVLVIVGVVVALWKIDSIARAAIVWGAEYALQVTTELDDVDVRLLKGGLALDGLKVHNPANGQFSSPHFLAMKRGEIEVSLGSLRRDVVEIPKIDFTGLDIWLEKGKDGKPNYQAILDNLKRFESKDPKQDASTKDKQKYVIRELAIRGPSIHLKGYDLAGIALPEAGLTLDDIILKDVGSDSDHAKSLAEVANVVIKAVLAAASQQVGKLPGDLVKGLSGGLKDLESLSAQGVKVAGDLGKQIETLGTGLGNATKAIDEATKGLGDLGKGLGNLLPGGTRPDPERKD